jgi:nucleolar protein 8
MGHVCINPPTYKSSLIAPKSTRDFRPSEFITQPVNMTSTEQTKASAAAMEQTVQASSSPKPSAATSISVPKEWRLHIGNISPKLASDPSLLASRFAKFGTVLKPLELHTKPLGDKHFAFITMALSTRDYERVRAAFHDVVFMGMKLSVAEARGAYNWSVDALRPDDRQRAARIQRDRIAQARAARIREATIMYPTSTEGHPTVSFAAIGPNLSSMGYLKSSHTLNDKSGNTKNKPPLLLLRGLGLYGADTLPPRGGAAVSAQQYSHTSGRGELIKGRLRVTPRSAAQTRAATMRILVNGELKTYKQYKTKLWGVEKRGVNELVSLFENGLWKSGDGHVVERVITKQVPNDAGDSIASEPAGTTENKVLASLFTTYDFDQPLKLEEDAGEEEVVIDSKGRKLVPTFDFELEGAVQRKGLEEAGAGADSDSSEASFDYSTAQQKVAEYTAKHNKPEGEVYYDEDDDGNELDFDLVAQLTEAIVAKRQAEKHDETVVEERQNANSEKQEQEENDEEQKADKNKVDEAGSDDEFVPTFGAPPTLTTEALRSLFKPDQQTFSLAVDAEDIDEEKERQLEEAAQQQQQVLREIEHKQHEAQKQAQQQRRAHFGLFWAHADSPFLATQAQISKFGAPGDVVTLPGEQDGAHLPRDGGENDYEKWFWSQRGELSRECKRRRRDVLRAFSKKKTNI